MASLAISNFCYKGVINITKLTLLGLALFFASYSIYGVTNTKLDTLRNSQTIMTPAQMAASEKIKQLECLTRNIHWEAAHEPFEGKVAVAQVTLNRLESGKFGKSICHVVFQRNVFYEKVVCQFSWTCQHAGKGRVINTKLFKESEEVAKKVYLENFRLPSMTKAMYFHNTSVKPGWRKEKIAQIGQHIFYKE